MTRVFKQNSGFLGWAQLEINYTGLNPTQPRNAALTRQLNWPLRELEAQGDYIQITALFY
jgi:hypothetical protein